MIEKTFYIETWGCQMNDLDTQRLSGQLKLRGYRRVATESEASLILLNTCSIREKAENKVYSKLGELKAFKSRGGRIGVCGCVAQQEGEALLERAPHVDFVLGPGNVGLLDEVLDGKKRIAIDFPEQRIYDYVSVDRPSTIRAQVTVIEGCNKNCTFCIVPTTRGREISRPLDQILEEVRFAVRGGRTEIELLGQTVNAYQCPVTDRDFADLLRAVASTPGVNRLRFVTSHPAAVTQRMIDAIRDHTNICRYLHLPAQSGSSAVLRRMKRLYTREKYLEILDRIRLVIPEMNFSTDFIVGFPGETEDDFRQTLSLMQIVRYGSLFAFKYSPRPGTPALKLPNPVPDEVATDRLHRLLALQEEIQRERLLGYVGRTVSVLLEGPSRHDSAMLSGRTDDNWTVNFRADTELPVGSLVSVRINQAQHYTLRGEIAA